MYTRSPIFVTRIRTTDTNSTTFIAIVNYPLPSSSSESRSSYHSVLFIRRNAPIVLFARIQHLLINPSWTRHRQQCVARQRWTQQRRDRTNRALNRRPQQREHAVSLQNTPDFWNYLHRKLRRPLLLRRLLDPRGRHGRFLLHVLGLGGFRGFRGQIGASVPGMLLDLHVRVHNRGELRRGKCARWGRERRFSRLNRAIRGRRICA